ncbi:hypothetical protein [Caballeronia novacaledonica]|uniref:hypothetical protein n=1 Tax=Caballeronia novacaledonica TaxID=1544861 RepID=UPI000D11DFDB|nr:hypothetical protein [Caballeronia novacaledonica]
MKAFGLRRIAVCYWSIGVAPCAGRQVFLLLLKEGTSGFFAGSRFGFGLLVLPLCGAAVTFFAAAKKVTKESSFFRPAVTRNLANFLLQYGTRLKSALTTITGFGSRTV